MLRLPPETIQTSPPLSTTNSRPLPSPALTIPSGLPGIAVTGSTVTLTAAGSKRDPATLAVGAADGDPVAVGADARLVRTGVGDDGKPQLAISTATSSDARVPRGDDTKAS